MKKFKAWDRKHKCFIPPEYISIDGNGNVYNNSLENCTYSPEDWDLLRCPGQKDKNGNEITEGDIVVYYAVSEYGKAVVEYETGTPLFVWVEQKTDSPSVLEPLFYFGCAEELEIIGNIYENPELAEQKGPYLQNP